MIEPYSLFPPLFYRFLHAYTACEATRHACNTWDTCDTQLPFGSYTNLFIYFTTLLNHVSRATDRPNRTRNPSKIQTPIEIRNPKSEYQNSKIPKFQNLKFEIPKIQKFEI